MMHHPDDARGVPVRGEVLALILWAGMIFGFSSVPELETGLRQDFFLRKVAHAVEFGVFAFLCLQVIQRKTSAPRQAVLAAVVLTALYALSDEFHQAFVPGREGALRDVLVDTVGGVVGIPVLRWIAQKFPSFSASTGRAR